MVSSLEFFPAAIIEAIGFFNLNVGSIHVGSLENSADVCKIHTGKVHGDVSIFYGGFPVGILRMATQFFKNSVFEQSMLLCPI